ncbi:hypothetical protein H9P43_008305 [Blastocladiella emersonii ATCC 22665]|nr:hypothetical protein H9P43_008305 [Blastocladiella emersonii ATCC 22665]
MRVELLLAVVALLASAAPDAAVAKKCAKRNNNKPAPIVGAREVPLAIPADQYTVPPAHAGDNNYVLKAGPNGEYMGGRAQAKPSVMNTVPVPRKSYEPRTTVKAAYYSEMPADKNVFGKPAVVIANCELKTKKPMLNLDNFVQIKKIACADAAITLTFDSDASAAKAATEWAKAKDFAVMVGREWKCNGKDENSLRQVVSVQAAPKGAELVFATQPISRDAVIDEFAIKVDQFDAPAAGSVSKRSIFNWNKKGEKVFKLNVNYDPETDRAVRDPISLIKTSYASASLTNTYFDGRATLSVAVTGSLIVVKTYDVKLSGAMKANLDVLITAYATARTDLVSVPIFVLPLNPVSIPGILSLGPELRLKAGLSYDLAQDLDFTAGFGFNYNFVLGASSQHGLFAKPVTINEGRPVFDLHPPKLSKDFQIGVAAHLVPEFSIAVGVWKIPAFDLALGVDNALGIQLSRGSFSSCPGGSLNLMLFHQHDLYFAVVSAIYSKIFNIYSTGRLPLPCPNNACNRCIGGSKNATTTTSLLPSTSTTSISTSATSTTTTSLTSTSTSSATTTTTSATTTPTSSSSSATTTTTSSSTSATPTTTSTSATTTSSATATGTESATSSSTSAATSATSTSSSTSTSATPTTTSTTTTSSSSSTTSALPTSTSTSTTSTSTSTTSTTTSTPAPTSTSTKPAAYDRKTTSTSTTTTATTTSTKPAYGRKTTTATTSATETQSSTTAIETSTTTSAVPVPTAPAYKRRE